MELYKIGLPKEESIVIRDTFVVDNIVLISIRKMNDSAYIILFLADQTSTETSILLQTAVNASSKEDKEFLDNHILNMNNITKDKAKLSLYIDATKDAKNDALYSCGFDMEELSNKPYFKCTAARAIDNYQSAVLDLLVTRDNFIKINLFFSRLILHDNYADFVFINKKFHNMKFSTVNRIKLDGSATDLSSKVVYNHYTCGNGPETYKFNFISRKIPGRKLRNPMNPEAYSKFYSDDFIVNDIVYEYHNDCLYIVYEVRSDITDRYKETKVLRFNKEFYDRSNFIDMTKIYEEEENK